MALFGLASLIINLVAQISGFELPFVERGSFPINFGIVVPSAVVFCISKALTYCCQFETAIRRFFSVKAASEKMSQVDWGVEWGLKMLLLAPD
jgi:hypothetical protein